MSGAKFKPHRLLRNRHLQSVANGVGPRRWRGARLRKSLAPASTEEILDCGGGVRLQGFFTPAPAAPRGLVVLFHGWEGSADSAYMLSTTAKLRRQGFAVARLNFRDHGDTHHLNRGIFHSCRLGEVVAAVKALIRRHGERPLMLAGLSLGGNFALRAAMQAPAAGIPVQHVFALCPVINPARTLTAMENGGSFYQRYFLRKWRRSLKRKQALFPGDYDFSSVIRRADIRALTHFLVEKHSEFATLEAYLDGYALTGNRLRALEVPATILAARDDPINPIQDFGDLDLNGTAELVITDHGGHCGYATGFRLDSWAEDFLVHRLAQTAGNRAH